MVEIMPNGIYSGAELREIIGYTLLARIRHCAMAKDRYLGKHVLEALDSVPRQGELSGHVAAVNSTATPARKGGVSRGNENPRANRISLDSVKLP